MTCGRNILIVDDDFDIRQTLREILEEEGYGVAEAEDGLFALEYLREPNRAPCLILLDWMMPRCDGLAFRTEQQADPMLAQIPVVLLSADMKIEEKARQVQATGVLRKPVNLDTLLETVRRHCAPQ